MAMKTSGLRLPPQAKNLAFANWLARFVRYFAVISVGYEPHTPVSRASPAGLSRPSIPQDFRGLTTISSIQTI
jgi:hypothetical protein